MFSQIAKPFDYIKHYKEMFVIEHIAVIQQRNKKHIIRMKIGKVKLLAAATLVFATVALSSCHKEKLNSDNNYTSDMSLTEDVYNEVFSTGAANSSSHKSLGCKVVTRDTLSFPKVITIDFGSGCTDGRGTTRSGQIIITYELDNFLDPGNNIQVSFNNYFQNNLAITGSTTYQNNGVNAAGNITMTGISSITTTSQNGNVTSLNSNQNYEMLSGQNTSTKEDDQYAVMGHTTGTSSNGSQLDYIILQQLIKNRTTGCNQFYVQGVTRTRKTGQPERYLDYGSGSCDNIAVETINGISQNITLD